MSAERSIETTGDTVEEAIAKGLSELGGVSPSDVIVEVLDEPSRGVFGIGARPAKVRLKLFRVPTPPAPPAPASKPEPPARSRQSEAVQERSAPKQDIPIEHDEDESAAILEDMELISDEAAMDEDVRVAKVVLEELLSKMEILRTQIVVRRALTPVDGETNPWLLDITGSDVSALVGRRGETLAALQYVTRLISSRELQHRANIIVDAGGYKIRRSRMLRDLANRMADQATRSKRVVTLEPMPPYERRIIHMTLRARADVQTKSVGEGNARKVTIIPK
ncbi:MAG: Jag N-terminal domain-containing protein [Anaerolineae bacterium]|nr:Jag N-terminal domain-containing protein [Anaerolineae bacterium]